MDAENALMKLRNEFDKLKEKRSIEVTELKTKIEQYKSETESIRKELKNQKQPKKELSVSIQ